MKDKMKYPYYCNECIHKIVCKYIDKVQEWENRNKGKGTGTDYKSTPIQIKCGAKLVFEDLKYDIERRS